MNDICTYCNEPFNHDADREYAFGALVCDVCFESLQFIKCSSCGIFVQSLYSYDGICEDCDPYDEYDSYEDDDCDGNWFWD